MRKWTEPAFSVRDEDSPHLAFAERALHFTVSFTFPC
jgi:hypothetical protein